MELECPNPACRKRFKGQNGLEWHLANAPPCIVLARAHVRAREGVRDAELEVAARETYTDEGLPGDTAPPPELDRGAPMGAEPSEQGLERGMARALPGLLDADDAPGPPYGGAEEAVDEARSAPDQPVLRVRVRRRAPAAPIFNAPTGRGVVPGLARPGEAVRHYVCLAWIAGAESFVEAKEITDAVDAYLDEELGGADSANIVDVANGLDWGDLYTFVRPTFEKMYGHLPDRLDPEDLDPLGPDDPHSHAPSAQLFHHLVRSAESLLPPQAAVAVRRLRRELAREMLARGVPEP